MFSINKKVAKLGAFEVELKGQEDNSTYGKHLGGFCSCLTRRIRAFAEVESKTYGGLQCYHLLPLRWSSLGWLVCARAIAIQSLCSHKLHQSLNVRDTSDALQLAVTPKDVSKWIL